jgi:hypothetical protein
MMNDTTDSSHTPEQLLQLGLRLEGIFTPYAKTQREAAYTGQDGRTSARFVHYTSAAAAIRIIQSKRMWMRNTTCMADYSEVQHGIAMLRAFLSNESHRASLIAALDDVSPNLAIDALTLFEQWQTTITFSTYIASISEHDDQEDLHGRLSMWRAFGGNTARVAIVVRVPSFSNAPTKLNVLFSPVAYLKEDEVHSAWTRVIENVRRDLDFLRSVDRQILVNTVFTTLVTGVTCLKHEGFKEEREWRVIYSPYRLPSTLMESSIEIVAGIPQTIYKLPLDVSVSDALADLDLACMFDRLIIGPSQFSWAMFEAFSQALTGIGVEQAGSRVCISNIPIRS